MKEYTFTFTEEETNQVINAIASKPYGEVFKLMNKIQEQIRNSVRRETPSQTPEDDE